MESSYLTPASLDYYRKALHALNRAGAPYLVGGAYAFERYTGIERHTRDFDVFCRPDDVEHVLEVLSAGGHRPERTFPHWLAKLHNDETGDYIDVIYSSGSGIALVDDEWFDNRVAAEVLGVPSWLCPAEEIVWSKGFVMERERYDGNDVAHLFRARAEEMDWERLLRRFGAHWRILFCHLILFGFIYPSERHRIPAWVIEELTRRTREEASATPGERVCQGTLVSRAQYMVDVHHWGYRDARLDPEIAMTPGDIEHWTHAIEAEEKRRREEARALRRAEQ